MSKKFNRVQLNIFKCDGIAIGLCILRQLADMLSRIMFVNTFVAISRGEADYDQVLIKHPEFVLATLFPPKDDIGYDLNATFIKNVATRRFEFKSLAIKAIDTSMIGEEQ
ncbi:Transferase [Parasponia andersonii]|uniref:Transferase n=1 Tax=Parasponia andersonii TaxID=3476 RepID=A0A2P5AT49_PARAD|nr:Transferase [Parasponia andersonii]